ncbi:hypothetical protein PVK06_008438 [Gossypium arboreum]|uniref:DUF4216 domain-containing protein n=1 Tax=Gossypium arboreum TaxID=29729 RepID=A0ABR0QJY2_GOSAR|nr:hypothetical protein PVK06_008438 [Gossypium arboreum]
MAEECITFCSRYLEDVETRLNRPSRNAGFNDLNLAETYLFQSYGEPIGKVEIAELDDISWIQAHRYVLFHHDLVELLCNEYKQILRSRTRSRRLQHREINKLFTEYFHEWLSRTVWSGKDVNDKVKWLSQGPNRVIKRYSAFLINGYKFHTKYRERMRRTQNCGVIVNSSITSYASARNSNPIEGNVEYYGLLIDIIELDYYGRWKVVLFRCDWADVNTTRGIKKDQFGFTMVNLSRLIHTGQQLMDEPYIFSSQAKQVFYSKDPTDEDWYVVLRNTPRDLFDMGNGSRDDIIERSETLPFPEQHLDENIPSTTESGGTHRVRGRTLLRDLYDLDPVERVKERFSLEVSDDYIKKALGKKWRDNKSTLKKQYFKKDISLEEKLRNVPPGMLRYQWEDAVRFWNSKKERKKDGSPMTSEAGEIMEKLKKNKAKYEAIASTDSSVNLENIDNRIITKVLGPERIWCYPTQYFGFGSQQYMPSGSQAQAEVQRLRDQNAQMQVNTVKQIAEVQRKYKELQQQLRAEAAEREAAAAAREAEARAREAEVAAMAAEQSKKYDDL